MPADALRRFTPTPFKASFALDGVNVVVATNLQFLMHRLWDAWGSAAPEPAGCSVFDWRVVVEPNDRLQPESTSNHYLSHDGLALITIGQNSFFACDLTTREGFGFISEDLVDSEELFHRNLLPAFVALVKAAADLTSASGC